MLLHQFMRTRRPQIRSLTSYVQEDLKILDADIGPYPAHSRPDFSSTASGPKLQTRTRARRGRAFRSSIEFSHGDRCTDHRPDQHPYPARAARGSNYRPVGLVQLS